MAPSEEKETRWSNNKRPLKKAGWDRYHLGQQKAETPVLWLKPTAAYVRNMELGS